MPKGLVVALAVAGATTFGVSAAAAPQVTLQIRPKAIVYGQEILLKGKIPSARAREKVVVRAHMCRFTTAVPVKTLKTRKGGVFSFRVGPTLRTTYSIAWGKAKSRAITVRVAPDIDIDKVGAGSFRISLSSGGGSTFEGKHALLQRLVGKRWRGVRSVPLKLTSNPDALTAVSSGTVSLKITRGTKLRAVFPLSQARPCYRAAVSSFLRT